MQQQYTSHFEPQLPSEQCHNTHDRIGRISVWMYIVPTVPLKQMKTKLINISRTDSYCKAASLLVGGSSAGISMFAGVGGTLGVSTGASILTSNRWLTISSPSSLVTSPGSGVNLRWQSRTFSDCESKWCARPNHNKQSIQRWLPRQWRSNMLWVTSSKSAEASRHHFDSTIDIVARIAWPRSMHDRCHVPFLEIQWGQAHWRE